MNSTSFPDVPTPEENGMRELETSQDSDCSGSISSQRQFTDSDCSVDMSFTEAANEFQKETDFLDFNVENSVHQKKPQ